MKTSEEIGKISEALAKAQAIITPAVYDGKNPHYRSRYATLAAIMETCRPALSQHGIAVLQGTSFTDEPAMVHVTTRLIHSSGQWIEEILSLKPVKADPQGIGSAITYARRYSLSALVGIVADDDDDGQKASHAPVSAVLKPAVIQEVKPLVNSGTTQRRKRLTRSEKLKEIFSMAADLNQNLDKLKVEISAMLKLDQPLEHSSDLSDKQVNQVLRTYRDLVLQKEAA